MKINNPSNTETIVCPECGATAEIIRISSITIDTVPLMLHNDVGEIYQCMNPTCMEYLEKVNDEFKVIKKIDLIRRQKEITDLLATESEIAKAKLYPKTVEAAIAKADVGKLLSSTLYTLTAESVFRRAYTVEEILEACAKIGLHPGDVDNSTIPYVVAWLEENKGT